MVLNSSPNNAGSLHDVLEDHHMKNHHPRPPNPDRLENLHQQAADESSTNEENKVVDPPKRSHSANRAASKTIGFYPHSWKDILEALKKKLPLGLVMDGTTSSCKTFIEKTVDDIGINNSYWDIYKCDMAIILWDDCATMWSEMKKAAQPIAASKFGILPSDIDNNNKVEDYNSVNEQGRTNNLIHDALGELCSMIFYKGDNALAKVFPNVFAEAIPEGAMALAASVLAAAIDK
ncbi:uncharacterized protein BJ212DRAFT_1480017 [Suillus subaureus]|uniref:DUF6532 domain-containing protein n=1 Tax=Suillus subaureus TaxID=48587 RepID=A0A9P7JEW9_9AGAM|nr:uncharacterized protein BJ212DRAFT_1480017 [Suillus subaureus]KAG1818201.1 hypothetical protein BJ212DRAFT_1480017 [Suillus subaureus]